MKNYLRLSCSNCLRTIDRAVNNSHYTPDKCIITLGCEGRLSPVKALSNPSIALTPEAGTRDWHPRQLRITKTPEPIRTSRQPTVITSDVIGINEGLVSAETGQFKQVILAVKASPLGRSSELPIETRVILDVASEKPRDYKHFIFRTESEVSEIGASDPALNPRPLRYNVIGPNPDIVEIRVNGVLRTRGLAPDQYQLYEGPTSVVPPNSIYFNSPLSVLGRTQVDITIFKSNGSGQQQTAVLKLQSELDDSRAGTGAYENVETVERFNVDTGIWETFNLYRMDVDASGLRLNTLLAPAAVQIETRLDFNSAFFLLARQPYSQIDRYNSMIVPFRNFSIDDKKFIKYYEDTQLKSTTMRVSVESLDTVYPLLKFNTFTVETPIRTALHGMSEQVTIDGNIIVGPDS